MSAIASVNRLRVQRIRTQYLVAAEHPHGQRLRDRLDAEIVRTTANAIGEALRTAISRSDQSLWFFRTLELDSDFDASHDADAFGRALAVQIARKVLRSFADGADGSNVVRFADRAAYLASFLRDRAAGCAHQWYYAAFDGTNLLAVSSALRTVICDDPNLALAALQGLAGRDLRTVIAQLTPLDCRRVMATLTRDNDGADMDTSIREAWAAWRSLQCESFRDDQRDALHLMVIASPKDGSGKNLHAASVAIVRLVSLLRSSSDPTRLLIALAQRDTAGLYAAAGHGDAEALAPLLRGSPELLDEVRQAVIPKSNAPLDAEPSIVRYTRFGAAFVLLPMIEQLPLTDALRGWPDLAETSAIAMTRLLLMARCLGRRNAEDAFTDPLLRELCGVDPRSLNRDLVHWKDVPARARQQFGRTLGINVESDASRNDLKFVSLPRYWHHSAEIEHLMSAAACALLRSFARRLPGFARASFAHVWRNFLNFPASIEDEPSRRVVRMRRPPLGLVLEMMGINRGTYRIDRLDNRPFVLFPEA